MDIAEFYMVMAAEDSLLLLFVHLESAYTYSFVCLHEMHHLVQIYVCVLPRCVE